MNANYERDKRDFERAIEALRDEGFSFLSDAHQSAITEVLNEWDCFSSSLEDLEQAHGDAVEEVDRLNDEIQDMTKP